MMHWRQMASKSTSNLSATRQMQGLLRAELGHDLFGGSIAHAEQTPAPVIRTARLDPGLQGRS